MEFEYSNHFIKKMKYRKDIEHFMIEYCIINSEKIKDREWEETWNAITKIPPSGRILKVVYQIKGQNIKSDADPSLKQCL